MKRCANCLGRFDHFRKVCSVYDESLVDAMDFCPLCGDKLVK